MKKLLFLLVLPVGLFTSCQNRTAGSALGGVVDQNEIVLREGDQVKVSFPGAPNLDAAPQPIRRDGKITLGIIGDVQATGMTTGELQSKLLALYAGQLLSKEIIVSVVASSFSIYVDGPVAHPGKITSDHPMTILEAIMEAGGFDYQRADTRHVQIIRHLGKGSNYTYFTVNVNDVLTGRQKNLFYLAPGDMVHVAEKFSLF